MNRILIGFCLVILMLVLGCSGGEKITSPATNPAIHASTAEISQTHLWGYYDVSIDIPSKTATAILNRQAMFTANVVNFINGKPAGLTFKINGTPVGTDYVDVDIDVNINHPFPGLPQYNGYDVRGIFMGDGSGIMNYNQDLKYPVLGTDQFMLADPADGLGGPDGYSRWYNKTEFSTGGMPLFQYTQGKVASPGFAGTATLCPYKYFADSLGTTQDLWAFLGEQAGQHGQFSSGASNGRNYYLRFPNTKKIVYGYAIIASWNGPLPTDHPANAPEAVACSVIDQSDLWFIDSTNKGGSLKLDVSLYDWDSTVSGGSMEDYKIFIESTVLSNPYTFSTTDMTPTGGGENYSTYHIEIVADNLNSPLGNENWIIAECADETYANNFGVSNLAQDDKLAAFFRYNLLVDDQQGNQPPTCDLQLLTPMPKAGYGPQTVELDASASTDPNGDTLDFTWDFDGDGIYGDTWNSGTSSHPFKIYTSPYQGQVCVKVTDGKGGESVCCIDVDVNPAQSKNQDLRSDVLAADLAVDPNNGNLLVLYEDAQVWQYTEASCYSQSSATLLFTAQVPVGTYNPIPRNCDYRIDIAPSGNMIASGKAGYPGWPAGTFSSTGVKLDTAPAPGAGDSVPDVYTYPTGGTYSNDHMFLCPGNGGSQNNMYRNVHSGWWWAQIYETLGENAPTGYDKVNFNQVVGAVGVSGDQFWTLEDSVDYFAARWKHTGSTWGNFNFDNAWFETGVQTSDDTGWYKAQDITTDSADHFYVLDRLASDQGRIKVFSSGTPGSALTSHATGDSSTISGIPLRIEGSSYISPALGNLIFVLHGGTTLPSKLSVFFPSEFGW